MPFERNNMSDTVQELEDMNPDRYEAKITSLLEKFLKNLLYFSTK